MKASPVLTSLLLATSFAYAGDYYVSPSGDDSGDGSRNAQFKTLAKASSVAQPGDRCFLASGVYRETLKPARSGEPGKPIVFAAMTGHTPIITGADRLDGWKKLEGSIYSVSMPWSLKRNKVDANI